ncbi:DEAD/DEAH box helicase [Thiospirochaeta perfilievii]|uniref:DEAD/DEAH box helicase n=1 Tax=Thiospirochaeta perfilievii TaxID=252967 RepID=A0A5C1QB19_9SPIO|nr:DEAD/DEAH box helicase [Thiospirochaeta perfilievii]QEN04558.1 DEAD/DEAH box helicase [Thiospirochaeta perfilievii]
MERPDLQNKLNKLQAELDKINIKRDILLQEIKNIQKQLNITRTSLSTMEKVKLFQSLFRGRTDVYPRRFETQHGKSGYSPVCTNQWKSGLCNKPKIKCTECNNRNFEIFSEETIYYHLKGHKAGESQDKEFVAGIYPILQDDTCYFLAIDFDKKEWENDIKATVQTCREIGIDYALERSRSGNGAHLWIFFDEPIPCDVSRKLGTLILTKTMEKYPELGFNSYDRMFPNQDKLPKGGFGNLIALPLQKKARNQNNSLFIDDDLNPYNDPWDFLLACKKYTKTYIENVLSNYPNNVISLPLPILGELDDSPWEKNFDLKQPKINIKTPGIIVKITLRNQLFISKKELIPQLQNQIIRLASFQNPEFYKKQAMRLSTWNIPRIITCAENHKDFISIPRGCSEDLLKLLNDNNINYDLEDKLLSYKPIDIIFLGKLYPKQKKAVKEILKYDSGILSATTAFGKTIVALYILASRKQKTLILVHRKQLQDQWKQRIHDFLGTDVNVGTIGGGNNKPTGIIDIALLQSLNKKGKVDPLIKNYGQLIVDECHHISAPSFERIAKSFTGKYTLGLTATLNRKDGQQPIITMNLGPVRFKVDSKSEISKSSYIHNVITRYTNFNLPDSIENNEMLKFNQICKELVSNNKRNEIIINDAVHLIKNGATPIILTERREHVLILHDLAIKNIGNVITLFGGMGKKKQKKALDQINSEDNNSRLIIATGKYIGEGFDDPKLDTLLLAMPISWKGTLTQYAGRLHRSHHNKKEVQIYDYVDQNIPMLNRMYNKRKAGYKLIGYNFKDVNYENDLLK